MEDLRVALAITHNPVGAMADNLASIDHWAKVAQTAGAQLICFPELNLTGYTTKYPIETTALPFSDPSVQQLPAIAQDTGLAILAGFAEKDQTGAIYATHLVATPNGQCDSYRKVHLSPPELDHFSPGNSVPLFTFKGVNFGIQLCYDTHFPELSTQMALAGADVIFMPHASPRVTPEEKFQSWMRHLPARAFDNSVYVLACNQTGENGLGLHFSGLAVAINPSGQIMDKDLSGEPGLLIVDLKSRHLKYVREHRMRYFLPSRRPEIYRV